eukprot:9337827-Alexandrium_andersonii.AAC.1
MHVRTLPISVGHFGAASSSFGWSPNLPNVARSEIARCCPKVPECDLSTMVKYMLISKMPENASAL